MKKVIAFLTIMAVFSTAVFAAPLSVAGSLDTASSEFSLAGQPSADPNGFDDLFADVNAAALTEEEALAVEGEGWFSGLISGIVTVAKVASNVAAGNVIGAVYVGIVGGVATYNAWTNPNTW
jgi:hypothetical protein